MEQGALNKERELARSMLADGMEIVRIARLADLSEAEIMGLGE
jgi:Holliday junction resolvase